MSGLFMIHVGVVPGSIHARGRVGRGPAGWPEICCRPAGQWPICTAFVVTPKPSLSPPFLLFFLGGARLRKRWPAIAAPAALPATTRNRRPQAIDQGARCKKRQRTPPPQIVLLQEAAGLQALGRRPSAIPNNEGDKEKKVGRNRQDKEKKMVCAFHSFFYYYLSRRQWECQRTGRGPGSDLWPPLSHPPHKEPRVHVVVHIFSGSTRHLCVRQRCAWPTACR